MVTWRMKWFYYYMVKLVFTITSALIIGIRHLGVF